jgi:zinc D-Ala-D-Ala carboxypeptidase
MTPHFTRAELACRCGCGTLPEQYFMTKVEALRVAYGKPLTVTSAARCSTHNANVSGTGMHGPHTTGRAIDFAVDRGDAYRLTKLAFEHGFTGIGWQQKGASRFVHIDDLPDAPGQPRPTTWSY